MRKGTGLKKVFIKRRQMRTRGKIMVSGVERGVGATHFSILLANYCTEILKKRTVIIDFNRDSDYIFLGKNMGREYGNKSINICYRIGGVVYYPRISPEIVKEVFLDEYECVIIDAGNNYLKYSNEAAMCDRRFLLAAVNPWRIGEFIDKYEKNMKWYNNSQCKCVYTFGDKECEKYLQKRLDVKFNRMPFVGNPFKLDLEQVDSIKRVFWEE